jgi:hypothetical protein
LKVGMTLERVVIVWANFFQSPSPAFELRWKGYTHPSTIDPDTVESFISGVYG